MTERSSTTAARPSRCTSLSFAIGCVVAGLLAPAIADAAPSCAGFVTDGERRTVQALPRPGYLRPYRDPAFGSRVTRISDTPRGQIVKTLYGTVQAWNVDETRLVLYHSGGPGAGHHLYDGRSYEHLGQLPFAPSDIEELFWDPKRASFLYYVQKKPSDDEFFGQLVRYDVRSGKRSAVADVMGACGNRGTGVVPTAGSDVHGMYGDHVGLRCRNDSARGQANDETFHVNVRTGEIGPSLSIGPTVAIGGGTSGSLPNVSVAATPSNGRFLMQGSILDREANFVRRVDMPLKQNAAGRRVPGTEHDSVGRLANGHDALFTPQFDVAPAGCGGDARGGVGTLVAHDLQNGRCHVMIGPGTGWDYPLSGIHHSALSRAGGWVATSTVGYGQLEYLSNGRPAPTLLSEITLTRATPAKPVTCRLAHARTHGKSARRTARSSYFGEPHPVISPSGTRILFSSDWHDSGTVDTFVIDLSAGATKGSGRRAAADEPEVVAEVVVPDPVVEAPRPEPEPEPVPTPRPATAEPDDAGAGGVSLASERRRYAADVERVAVTFEDASGGDVDRVTIARVGSPDTDWKMWLYTNGTQRPTPDGPTSGRLSFLRLYLGTGRFEARSFRRGTDEVVVRARFAIGD